MNRQLVHFGITTRALFRKAISGPHILAFLPALVLGSYWYGGEPLLIATALGFPLCFAIAGTASGAPSGESAPTRDQRTSENRPHFERELEILLKSANYKGNHVICFIVIPDALNDVARQHGPSAAEHIIQTCHDRLRHAMRSEDLFSRVERDRIAGAILSSTPLDHEGALVLIRRLTSVLQQSVTLDGLTLYPTVSAGYVRDAQVCGTSGQALFKAAGLALDDALQHAPSAIRAYSAELSEREVHNLLLKEDIKQALSCDQFEPWFQPQLCTDTGMISGFEALARWRHPKRGTLTPVDFLPQLDSGGNMQRLGDTILSKSLASLQEWDKTGLTIPQVAINFASAELRDPKLVEKVAWELDRHNIAPERLVVEVLETVVATSPDDTITLNINRLANLGCAIDLDDFGTGHASIASIRRFSVQRLKIDRSFVTKVDQDTDQQRMVSAILLMAERLGLGTVAEGVETAGEHAMLAQLGCTAVQGFGIARPMPASDVPGWCRAHIDKLASPPPIARKSG